MKEVIFKQTFDDRKMSQYVNNEPSVFHCHHYITLYTKLALETKDIYGPELLAQSMEETYYLVLKKYFIINNITGTEEKIKVSEKMYSLVGMGIINFTGINENGGRVVLERSHVDEGWVKKFSKSNEPLNYVTCGYIQGALSVIYSKSIHAYMAKETESIATGKPKGIFEVKLKGA